MSNYSNDFTQIRSGLVNYIGSCSRAINLPEKAGKQTISAMLVEEAINLSTNEDKTIDQYTVKPVYRATKNLLEIKVRELKAITDPAAKKTAESAICDYEVVIKKLAKLIDSIKE